MSDAQEDKNKGDSEEKVSLTPAEVKASEAGWVPEADWKGEPDEWVRASDFNIRGELMHRISEQSSIIKHLESKVVTRDTAIDDLQELQTKISDKAYKDAMRDLKAKKVQALDDDDSVKVVQLDDEISELQANKPTAASKPNKQPPAHETPKEVTDWLEAPRNQWYAKDTLLRSIADGISKSIMDKSPNITPTALLAELDKTIRKELPHKFTPPTGVDGGDSEYNNTQHRQPKLPAFSALSEEQQAAGKRFAALGLMTKKEYIEELAKTGDI